MTEPLATMQPPQVDEVWRRSEDGKARVRIGRVWHGAFAGFDTDWVRCHPVHGGRVWTAPVDEFVKRYEREV